MFGLKLINGFGVCALWGVFVGSASADDLQIQCRTEHGWSIVMTVYPEARIKVGDRPPIRAELTDAVATRSVIQLIAKLDGDDWIFTTINEVKINNRGFKYNGFASALDDQKKPRRDRVVSMYCS